MGKAKKGRKQKKKGPMPSFGSLQHSESHDPSIQGFIFFHYRCVRKGVGGSERENKNDAHIIVSRRRMGKENCTPSEGNTVKRVSEPGERGQMKKREVSGLLAGREIMENRDEEKEGVHKRNKTAD